MTKLLKCLRCLRFSNGIGRSASRKQEYLPFIHRPFHTSTPVAVLKPFLLPDIGEGLVPDRYEKDHVTDI